MKKSFLFHTSLLFIISITNLLSQNTITKYFNQSPPGNEAKIFAPGFVTSGMSTRDITISMDGKELYFVVFGPAFNFSTILYSKEINGNWSTPEVASFAQDSKYKYIEPCLSYDGSKIFFASNRNLNDSTSGKNNFDIWFAERKNNSWSEPTNLGEPISTSAPEFFPSLTKTGTLYFTREAENGTSLIMRSKFVNGIYLEPERLPEQINFGADRFNAFIDPEEKYIIVSVLRAKDGKGGADYYIIFRNDNDTWNEPINMGDKVNSAFHEYSPYVSPDEKYFFFMSMKPDENLFKSNESFSLDRIKKLYNSPGNGNSTIYWIDGKIIDELKAINSSR